VWGWWKTSRQIKYGVLSWSSNYRKQCHKTCELAFADAVRLYNHWRVEPPNVPAPTLGFRTLKVSLSGICDLVTAYKNEPLPLAVHDQLWTLIVDMKLKAELAIDPSYATGARCLDALIQDRRTASDGGTADTLRATLAPNDKPEL
jgi:hypothetical protein